MTRISAVVFVAVALAYFQGCCCPCGLPCVGLPVGPNIPNVPNVNPNPNNTTITIPTADGGVSISGGENLPLPEDLADDIPVYEGVKVTSNMKLGGASMLTLTSEATVGELTDYYETQMEERGWKIEANMKTGEGTQIVGTKNEGKRKLMAIIADNGDERTIALTLPPDEE